MMRKRYLSRVLCIWVVCVIGVMGYANISEAQSPNARQDKYGDPLPLGAIRRIGTTRLSHGTSVNKMVFSPEGKTLVSTNWSVKYHQKVGSRWWKKLGPCLWDAGTGTERQRFAVAAHEVVFSPDGNFLVMGDDGGQVHVWNRQTRAFVGQFRLQHLATDEGPIFFSLVFSPDSKNLAASHEAGVEFYDVTTRKQVAWLPLPGEVYSRVHFFPDGKRVLTWGQRTIQVWDWRTGKLRHRIPTKSAPTNTTLSPDGSLLAVVEAKTLLRVWDTRTGKIKYQRQQPAPVPLVHFTADGKHLVGGNYDGSIIVWDGLRGKRVRTFSAGNGIDALTVSPVGNKIATARLGKIHFWNALTGKETTPTKNVPPSIEGLTYCAVTKQFASFDSRFVYLWDATTEKEVWRSAHAMHIRSLTFSPHGKYLAVDECRNNLRLLEARSGQWTQRMGVYFPAHTKVLINVLAFSPDDTKLVVGGHTQPLQIRAIDTGKQLAQLPKRGLFIGDRTFSADGNLLAGVYGVLKDPPCRVLIWDVDRAKILHDIGGFRALPHLAFSPDNKFLAVACEEVRSAKPHKDHWIRLWNVSTGKLVRRVGLSSQGYSKTVFALDSRMLISAGQDHHVRLWETSTGKQRRGLQGHKNVITNLFLTKDGHTAITASDDQTILFWNLLANLPIQQPKGKKPPPKSLPDLWADLAGSDAMKAFDAICQLAATPKTSVPFLSKHLKAVPKPDPQRISKLINDLDNKRFAIRAKATRELQKLHWAARPALERMLKKKTTLEMRLRLEKLLDMIRDVAKNPEQLRNLRAVETLEYIGTAEAKAVLQRLAKGAPGALLTVDASMVLRRMARKK